MTDNGPITPASRAAGLRNALEQLSKSPSRRIISNAEAQRLLERGLAELSCGGLTLTPCGRRALAEINGHDGHLSGADTTGPRNGSDHWSGEISRVLISDAVIPACPAMTKKELFHDIAAVARDAYGLDPKSVNDGLWDREKLASTAVCRGVAIPHARLSDIDAPVGIFVRLKHPMNFGAADGQGVDLVFVVLSPASLHTVHLMTLARVARLLGSKEMSERIRSTSGRVALYTLITEPVV